MNTYFNDKNIKKQGRVKLALLLCILICSLTVSGCSLLSFFDSPDESEIITGNYEMAQEINRALAAGQDELVLYVRGINEDDIYNITSMTENFWGVADTYAVRGEYEDGTVLKVRYDLSLSDSYYAYQNYMHGAEIPEENADAAALAQKVREVLSSIISESMSTYEKELAIHDYLVSTCEYVEGSAKTRMNSAYGALVEQRTMCNGYAEAMRLLLACSGVESLIVTGVADGVDHAWNKVNVDGTWYHVDATWDDPTPDDPGKVLHTYFNLPDDLMMESHTWDETLSPACTGEPFMYYKWYGLYCNNYSEYKRTASSLIRENKPAEIEIIVPDYSKSGYDLNFAFRAGADEVWYSTVDIGPYTMVLLEMTY